MDGSARGGGDGGGSEGKARGKGGRSTRQEDQCENRVGVVSVKLRGQLKAAIMSEEAVLCVPHQWSIFFAIN